MKFIFIPNPQSCLPLFSSNNSNISQKNLETVDIVDSYVLKARANNNESTSQRIAITKANERYNS